MKKIISLLLVFVMVFNIVSVLAEDNAMVSWDDRLGVEFFKDHGIEWPFCPADNVKVEQNAPDFSWPYVEFATSYDLEIYTDPEMKNIAYEARKLDKNYYNFNNPFEKGKTYYWRVRFDSQAGYSEWSDVRRFTILPEAIDIYLPDMVELISNISEIGHPRSGSTKATIESDRLLREEYPSIQKKYDDLYTWVNSIVTQVEIQREELSGGMQKNWNSTCKNVFECAVMYTVSGEQRFADYAIEQLMEITTWDNNGGIAYKNQDQLYREMVYYCAAGYDLLYDLLSKEQKEKILEMIKVQLITLENPQEGLTSESVRSLNYAPYLSHGWTALSYFLAACLCVAGDLPEADNFLKEYIRLYFNIAEPWGEEDGGYMAGVDYWSYSEYNFLDYMLGKFGIPIYQKPQFQNRWKQAVYLQSKYRECEFGDVIYAAPDTNDGISYKIAIAGTHDPYMKWAFEKYELSDLNYVTLYYYNKEYEETESKAPLDKPRSHYFEDIGVVAMHSDLINSDEQIIAYFRSSPYGARGHAHNDQNSFHIHAYGERLAIDSGYYDSVRTDHDKYYHRKTFAHNSITYDGGIGQGSYSGRPSGKITNYLTHVDFDMVTGDATESYQWYYDGSPKPLENEVIDKAERHFIYLRPDIYLVIDDLATKNEQRVNFEWWLNAFSDISLYEDRTGARIVQGKAALDAKVHYPNVTGFYSDLFSGPDLVHVPAIKGYAASQVNKRVWFKTPLVNKTKMITTMDVRRSGEDAPYVDKKEYDGYILLSFEDGTKAYVATGDKEINSYILKSDADAVILKGSSIMMVDGTYLDLDGERIITSDNEVSLTLGKDEIGVSCKVDCNVAIKTSEVKSLKTLEGVNEETDKNVRGFIWNYKEGMLNISAITGQYMYYINDKVMPGGDAPGSSLTYYIGNDEKTTALNGYVNHDGLKVLNGTIENDAGFYRIDTLKNIKFKGASEGDIIMLKRNEEVIAEGDGYEFKITPITKLVAVEETSDYQSMQEKLDSFTEAEAFVDKTGDVKKYTTRSFLSGGAGANNLDAFGTYAVWSLNAPKDGTYDLVVKYAGFNGVDGIVPRIIKIGDNYYTANIIDTGSYGPKETDWHATRIRLNVPLKKGENLVTIYPISGSWNLDWLGFVTSNKE